MVYYLQGDKGNIPLHDWQPSCEINTTRIYKKKTKQYVTLETHKYLRVSYFYLKQTEGTFRIIVKNTLNMIMHTYFSNLFTQVSHEN